MKLILALLAIVSLVGCTMIPGPHGTAQFWGDYTKLDYSDGPVHLKADTMTHSNVVRAHWHGASVLGAEAVAYGAGGPVAGAGVATAASFFNRQTNRATPTPTPAK